MKKDIYLDDIIYELNEDNSSYGVKEYVGTGDVAVIKEEINGLKVTEIHFEAFKDAHTISSLIIPDSIRVIESQDLPHDLIYNIYDNGLYLGNENNPYVAFVKQKTSSCYTLKLHEDCKAQFENENNYDNLDLIELYIPATVTNLDPFGLCGYVERVVIDPNNEVYKVEGNCIIRKEDSTLIRAFENASIPYGVKAIGEGAFCYSNLTSVEIPDTVQFIDRVAFASSRLREIRIPASVKVIRRSAFDECCELNHLILDGKHTIIERKAFYRCPLHNLVIDNDTTAIEYGAFDEEVVKEFNLNEGPEEEKEEHEGSGILSQDIHIWDLNKSFDSKEAISLKLRAYSLGSISLNPGLVKLSLDLNDPLFDTLAIPEGVKYLSLSISKGNISEVIIPNSVEYIEDISVYSSNVRYNKYSKGLYLGNEENPYLVFVGEDIESDSEFKFHPDTKFIAKGINVENVVIPEGVAEICQYAFRDCDKLFGVRIPDGVQYLENYAFENCSSLRQVHLPDGLEILKTGVFYDCSKVVFVSKGIKAVSDYAVSNPILEARLRKQAHYVSDRCVDFEDGYYSGFHNEPFTNSKGSIKQLKAYQNGINDRFLSKMILSSIKEGNASNIRYLVDEIYDISEVLDFGCEDHRYSKEFNSGIYEALEMHN